MSIIDTLKAIGLPVTAAAVVSALVVSVPLLFKLDERYAKEEDLKSAVAELAKANDDLQRELAQLSGFQQAMTTFISEGRIPVAPQVVGGGAPLRRLALTPRPPAVEVPPPATFDPNSQPPTGAGAPTSVPPVVAEAASAPEPVKLEKPRNWRELSDALGRQQERLVIPRER